MHLGNCVWISNPEAESYISYCEQKNQFFLEKFHVNELKNSMGLWIIEGLDVNDGSSVIKFF